ncbi:MAG: hypothetical protein ABEK50_13790 [bacterium]
MDSVMMLSLVILAFLIFMIVVLMYINRAAKQEINKVKLQMLVRFSVELCDEMYSLDELNPEDRVDKAFKVLENVIDDWQIDLDYNKYKIKSKLRNYI